MTGQLQPGDRVKALVGLPCRAIARGHRGTVIEIETDGLVRWRTDRGYRARYMPSELERTDIDA